MKQSYGCPVGPPRTVAIGASHPTGLHRPHYKSPRTGIELMLYEIRITLPAHSPLIVNCFARLMNRQSRRSKYSATRSIGRDLESSSET